MERAAAFGYALILLGVLAAGVQVLIQFTWPWSGIVLALAVVLFAALRLGKRKYQQMLWFRAEAEYLSAKCDDENAVWLKQVITDAEEYERNERVRRMQERRDERWRRGAEREGCTVVEFIERELKDAEDRQKRYVQKMHEREIEKAREEEIVKNYQGRIVKRC